MIAAILFVLLFACRAGAQNAPRPPDGSTESSTAAAPPIHVKSEIRDGPFTPLPAEPRTSPLLHLVPPFHSTAEAGRPSKPAWHSYTGPLAIESRRRFDWQSATLDALRFLMLEHAARIAFQDKTRDRLGGPVLKDYCETLRARSRSFGDGDSFFTNWIAHPIQGATAYHLARANSASRSQSFWWGVAYSTQFEVGILSEAMIGNVGLSPVDLVVTPTLGYALGRTEEWLVAKMKRSRMPWLRRMAPVLLPGRFLSALTSGK